MATTDGSKLAGVIREAVQRALAAGTGSSIAEAVRLVPAGDIGTFLHATFDEAT